MTNTINRAELTGIAAASTNKYTKIATDSACSLSQIRKQLLFPEMQRDHIQSNLLEQIASMIYASPELICFYKVKAHSGIAGNECADAIAKQTLCLHDGGHDVHFQPPAPDGNAYTHLYWLAGKDTDEDPSRRGAITPRRVQALSDLKAKLKIKNKNVPITQTEQYQNRHRVLQLLNRILHLWSINKPQMLSGTTVISNSTKSVML